MAPKVKTVVFKNVAEPDSWEGIPFDDGIEGLKRSDLAQMEHTWSGYHARRRSSWKERFATLLDNAMPRFHNLKAVLTHEGFYDERPYGPDASVSLARMFWYSKRSVEKLDMSIWTDRATLRMFENPNSYLWNHLTMAQDEAYLDSFSLLWKRCLEVAMDQDRLKKSKTIHQKFKNMSLQGKTRGREGLLRLSPQQYLNLGSSLTSLELCYAPSDHDDRAGFNCDVRLLHQSQTGFTNLETLALKSDGTWPLDVRVLGQYGLSLPKLDNLSLNFCRFPEDGKTGECTVA